MSGFTAGQLGGLGQVKVADYSGLGALVAKGGGDPAGSLLSGYQTQSKLGQEQQAADQVAQVNAMKIEAAKKELISNTAFGITQLPVDKQQDAYNEAVMGMAKQGLINPADVKHWNDGGADMVKMAASQSPLALQAAKMNVEMQKATADIDLTKAKTAAENMKLTNPQANQKPLSADAAKIYEISSSGADQVQQLKDVYGKVTNPNLSSMLPNGLQSDNAQKVTFLKNDLSDRIGRLRSGGALNADEVTKFMKLLPSVGDSDETVQAKLSQLQDSFSSITKSIAPNGAPGSNTGSLSPIQQLQQQYPGLSAEQASAIAKKMSLGK